MTYAVCYLHIKQNAISQERRAIWKNYRWSSFIISRVLSNKTKLNFHFIYTLNVLVTGLGILTSSLSRIIILTRTTLTAEPMLRCLKIRVTYRNKKTCLDKESSNAKLCRGWSLKEERKFGKILKFRPSNFLKLTRVFEIIYKKVSRHERNLQTVSSKCDSHHIHNGKKVIF